MSWWNISTSQARLLRIVHLDESVIHPIPAIPSSTLPSVNAARRCGCHVTLATLVGRANEKNFADSKPKRRVPAMITKIDNRDPAEFDRNGWNKRELTSNGNLKSVMTEISQATRPVYSPFDESILAIHWRSFDAPRCRRRWMTLVTSRSRAKIGRMDKLARARFYGGRFVENSKSVMAEYLNISSGNFQLGRSSRCSSIPQYFRRCSSIDISPWMLAVIRHLMTARHAHETRGLRNGVPVTERDERATATATEKIENVAIAISTTIGNDRPSLNSTLPTRSSVPSKKATRTRIDRDEIDRDAGDARHELIEN